MSAPPVDTATVRRDPRITGVLYGVGTLLTATVAVAVVLVVMRGALLADLRTYLGRTALTAAATLDGDSLRRFTDSSQTGSPAHRAATRPLDALILTNPDIRFAYAGIIRRDTMFFVLDGDSSASRAYVMEPAQPTPGELEVWSSRTLVVDRRPSATEWGPGIRAYAPVFDHSHVMAGYVGVTMSAATYMRWTHRLEWSAAFGLLGSLVLSAVAGIRVTATERTRERADAQLRSARELSEHASRMKSRFLANMSHELRTPLNGVIGTADLLEATPLTPTQRRHLQALRASSHALLALVNDVLDISRIEAGRVQLRRGAVDLHALVGEILDVSGATALSRGLRLTAHVAPECPSSIVGDEARLRQVLLNLVGNALKFTQVGGVDIRVTRDNGGSTDHIRFAVTDTGIGIPADQQGLVFEAFRQVEGSDDRSYGGSGLGLAITRDLVRLMGGEVGLESRPGAGSTFWFVLPVDMSVPAEAGGAGVLPVTATP